MNAKAAQELPLSVRESLALLAHSSDRTSPAVFVGRKSEFELLDNAVRGAQRGEAGHTTVIQGVPGAGKTSLLREYAARLLAERDDSGSHIVPVPLQHEHLDAPPEAVVAEIDRRFRQFQSSKEWAAKVDRVVDKAALPLIGNMLFTAFTRRKFREFRPSSKAPNSLFMALDDYATFRLDRRKRTIVLLVDEAQNLIHSNHVVKNLSSLHGAADENTKVLLVCFGLANTVDRLLELGLSRLASDHIRTIGTLSRDEARETVTRTLEKALAHSAFDVGSSDDHRRKCWIGEAADTILAESSDFPHHLTNGCRALAKIVLEEGIDEKPPVARLRESCAAHKREYYDARLHAWRNHSIALAHAFTAEGWTPIEDVVPVLMASDDYGATLDAKTAVAIIEGLEANGYLERTGGDCQLTVPSLASHFADLRIASPADSKVVRAVRAALPDSRQSKTPSGS